MRSLWVYRTYVETSLDTARKSACATCGANFSLPRRHSCRRRVPHLASPFGLALGSRTTAAERSGFKRGFVFSSPKTAENVLTGLPSADDAMGLANSKCAARA